MAPASWPVRNFCDNQLFGSIFCKVYKGRVDPAAEQAPRSKSCKLSLNVSQKDRKPFHSDKNMSPVKQMAFNHFPFFLSLKNKLEHNSLYSERK